MSSTATVVTPPKAKRLRVVVDKAMVAHLWAHQSQEHARTGRDNFYFRGDTIYSYGPHFPIARFVPTAKGKPQCYLLTTATYSNTTSGHIWLVRDAIRGLGEVFRVPEVRGTSKEWVNHCIDDYLKRATKSCDMALKAVKRFDEHRAAAENLIAEGNRFAQRFGSRRRLAMPVDLSVLDDAKAKAEAKKALKDAEHARKMREDRAYRARQAKIQQERAARDQMEAAERDKRQTEWLAGEAVKLAYNDFPDGHRLRVRGSRIETSGGVAIEVEKCRPLLERMREQMRHGECPTRPLGPVESWGDAYLICDGTPPYVRIGCHTIHVHEIERIAAQLGL